MKINMSLIRLRLFKKKYLIVFASTLIMSILSCIYTYFIAIPVYESNTSIIIQMKEDETSVITYNDILSSQYMAKTYSEILRSNYIASLVATDLGLSMSSSELNKNISILLLQDTQIIKICAHANSPVLSRNIADGYAQALIRYSSEVLNIKNIKIVDLAELPYNPIWPKPLFNLIVGIFTGCLCGTGVAFFPGYLKKFRQIPQETVEKV